MRALRHSVVALTPFETPDVRLALHAARADALSVLDLGREPIAGLDALAALAAEIGWGYGVRLPEPSRFTPAQLAARAPECVVLPDAHDVARWRAALPAEIALFVQVTSLEEARRATAAGADALIAKGNEAGGRVGTESTFMLVQRLRREATVPFYAQGGLGVHTAAAAVAGGAEGVVLDTQLALTRESSLSEAWRNVLRALDGSETAVVCGRRVLDRPDAPAPKGQVTAADVDSRLGTGEGALLPIGQDAPLAKSLADRFRTVHGVLHGVRASIASSLTRAPTAEVLAPGNPLARAHGLRYPIFQGPMTRVSDRAAFADAVSREGGLPFLALALLRGAEVRALVEETRARLGTRPFGVGILGFVPPELRDEQLAALEGVWPTVALIAGGRPSQARPLEARGTATYLHVPSPGLLDLFLGEGARRFVFEGSECGGHVGPRTSFALWEAQLEKLAAFPDADALHVVFAGGIHDAVSSAMVAAMAAPLAARGAKVGVLMGTAYLFTKEAVQEGAILPGFQDAALRCEDTALLETAPGHQTRCAHSPFVAAFEEKKRELRESGADPKAMWAELESLNLGRLRIASKGVVRRAEGLVAVDEDAQAREGMYMLGQVAALRDAVTDIATLHAEVSEGAAGVLTQVRPQVRAGAPARPADVAIVGMACIFPGAPDLSTYWSNIVRGVDSVTEVPAERWSTALYFDPAGKPGEKTPSKWGAFLSDVPFDPAVYGIPPKSLVSIEPVQLLALEVARRALADAGYDKRELDRERSSVIFGAEAGTDLAGGYGFRALWPQYVGAVPEALDAVLPALTEDSFPGVLANVIAGRIANRLDLGGVNYTVDAACASSLAAVDLAVKELRAGTSDLVVCGGADLHNSIQDYLLFASVHALSPRGLCRTFDRTADGIVLGEGVAAIVCKRLEDAERDGDRVYAVIKAVAGSSDGRSLGLTAPHKDGQVRALERAHRQSGLAPSEIGLVEAHGTGTVVGDRTELATLTEVYRRAGSRVAGAALGSVKSQIGHTKCAAGLAGLIKVTLAAHHGVLPPTLNLESPNPYWTPESPFFFLDEARPWLDQDRRAAVSAFGFGGTNFHTLLEGRPARDTDVALPVWPTELVLVRGQTDADAKALCARALRRLEDERACLRDVAAAITRAGEGPVRFACVVPNAAALAEALADIVKGARNAQHLEAAPAGKVAFLFPGQGSQRVGMGSALFVAMPAARAWLRRAPDVARAMLPGRAFTAESRAAQEAALRDTRMAQPALGLASRAVADVLGACGVRPDVSGGHSYGELAALAHAGVFDDDTFVALSRERARHILAAVGDEPGTMAAVSATAERVAPLLQGLPVVIANDNAPNQVVLSGTRAGVAEALTRLEAAKVAARALPVACAFHSPLVQSASGTLRAHLQSVPMAAARWPVWSNVTASPHATELQTLRDHLAEQVGAPVRFREQVRAMYDAGARTFVEVGPGRVLTGLVGKILADSPHTALATDVPGESLLTSVQRVLGALALAGVAVDAAPLFAGRVGAERLDEAKPASPTMWLVNGQRARPAQGVAPKGGLVPVSGPVVTAGAAEPAGPAETAVVEYLRNMQTLADAQRDVMLRFLGAPAASASAPAAVDGPADAAASTPATAAAPAADAPGDTPAADVATVLLEIVSARTGYPVDMLGLDLDLEAELSIDSIKRIEILGELSKRTGLASSEGRDEVIEQLASKKTLRGILDFLAGLGSATASPSGAASASTPPPTEREDREGGGPPDPGAATGADAPSPARAGLPFVRGVVIPTPWVGGPPAGGAAPEAVKLACAPEALPRLSAALRVAGLLVADVKESNASVATYVDALLWGATREDGGARAVFERVRSALTAGAKQVLVLAPRCGLSPGAEPRVLGLGGLLRSLAKERPDVRFRVVHLAADAPDEAFIAARAALASPDAPIALSWESGALCHREVSLEAAAPHPLMLPNTPVVLVTGGARGITGRLVRALARQTGARFELIGRSPAPPPEPSDLDDVRDRVTLRRRLAQRTPDLPLHALEAEASRLIGARAIRETLADLTSAGSTARYHCLDVRDADALGALVDALYAEHGRIDGVIHGAGIIEDRRYTEKTDASFARVYDTKVAAARTLAMRLRDDLSFFALFASVSGLFGNAGQVDYAAANAALDELAHVLGHRWPGRVVALDFGPWAGEGADLGMVSPELARELARRGIGLIDLDEGVQAFLQELAAAAAGRAAPQVFLARGLPRAFAGAPPA